MSGAPGERHQLDRLVFFSDAVFAIAITLLVIEVHAPEELPAFTSAALWEALGHNAPQLLGFAISFAVIGIFWTSHHRAFGLVERTDERLGWRNLAMLFGIALLPFPTAIISRFVPLAAGQQAYLAALLLAALLQLRLFALALRPPYVAAGVDPALTRFLLRRATALPIVVALGLALTFVHAQLGLLTLLLVPLAVRAARSPRWDRRLRAGSPAVKVG